MDFAISGVHLDPLILVILGFSIGVMGGFFGVGGSFIAGPALFNLGIPMNYVVGTDLAHIAGKSVVAAKKHRALGNVDVKLGLIMTVGTVLGVEIGVQLIQYLKSIGSVDRVVGTVFLCVLVCISTGVFLESLRSLKSGIEEDRATSYPLVRWVQGLRLGPSVSLPTSGIVRISIMTIVLVALVGGFFSGFLGGGAGYIRLPMMIFLLGVPTHVAVGTDLFEIVVSASYGTFSHASHGNVDIMIALVMQTGAAVGANLGAGLTQFFSGPRIRLAFVPLPLIGAALILYKLLKGGAGH